MTRTEAYHLASGYAWGRQDAGDGARDTQEATDFARAYADRQDAYNDGAHGVSYMPNVRDAFGTWRRAGQIV